MGFKVQAAGRAATGICALWILAGLAGCEGTLGTSPPHAAPANPSAEGEDGAVVLSWNPVTDATRYVILWDTNSGGETYDNSITGIEDTTYVHEGLQNFIRHRYRIVAETSGGRGPESLQVTATPGPVPGSVEWAVVTAQNPGHTIHFAEAEDATGYRIYFAGLESQLAGRRPFAEFVIATGSPHVRATVPANTAVYYRVVAMNDTRIGSGGPVVVAPSRIISEHELDVAGAAFGLVNDDDCLDLPTATGGFETGFCTGSFSARVLADVGLGDLLAGGRIVGDARFADFDGDGFDELFTNTSLPASGATSHALLHVNDGEGEFQTSAAVTALDIAGVGGTLLAADFDNDGDVDLFAPNDHTQGDGARNWLLVNDGAGGFTDVAAAAGVDTNPAGDAYVPAGGLAVDFNEDGMVDLLFGSRLLLNDGDGTFSDGSTAANVPVRADRGLKLIDVDLDGDLDLIHHTGGETRLHRNTDGIFDDGELIGVEAVQSVGEGLNACDVNGDGFEDVVIARNNSATQTGTPKFLVNVNGSLLPTFTQEGTTADPDSLVAANDRLACGDEDRDGMIDVLSRWGESYRLLRGSSSLSQRIRLRIVGAGGERNQQGRVVRVVPRSAPGRIMTRVVDGGSGLRAQNMYDLLVGTPWSGTYDVTVRFADGEFTTTAEGGDDLIIFADGEVQDLDPDDEE
jgi:hypothetical protein